MVPIPLKRLVITPSRKFALLVVLGLCMVALPLAEAWRRLGLELRATAAARHGLTPLAMSVQTQRALAAHRPYAAAVLSGRVEQEGERARRQGDVDMQLATLGGVLEAQRLHRALDEADQLRGEWSALLQGIGQRRLQPSASDAAHQLLIEQTYVIADLVATAGLHGQAGRAFGTAEGALALVGLPRYLAALDALASVTGASPNETAALGADASARTYAARVAARRVTLAAADLLARAGAGAGSDSDSDSDSDSATAARAIAADAEAEAPDLDLDLIASLTVLQQSAAAVAHGSEMNGVSERAAARSALNASIALLHHLERRLEQAQRSLEAERTTVAAAGLIALLVAMLAAALALPRTGSEDERETQALRRSAEAADEDSMPLHTTLATQGAESEQPTSQLLQRLRRSEREPGADIDISARDTAQPGPTPDR